MNQVWLFADWNKLDDKERKTILATKCTDVVLGFASGHKKWQRSMSNDQIVENARWLTSHGIRCHLMFWLTRDLAFLQAAVKDTLEVLAVCEHYSITISSILYDAEEGCYSGTYSISSTVEFLLTHLHSKIQAKIQIGVTGIPKIHKSVSAILEICDYGLPQAYSCWFPDNNPAVKDGKHWSHSLSTEPRKIQRTAHREWGKFGKPLVIGNGCYFLTRPPRFGLPKMLPEENLRLCIEETVTLGYNKVAFWSLNNAHSKIVTEFIASLAEDLAPSYIQAPTYGIDLKPAQWLLATIGYNLGNSGERKDGVDGDWGPKSQAALNSFRSHISLDTTGTVCLKDMLALVDYYKKMKLSNR